MSDAHDNARAAYFVQERGQRFEVGAASGRTVMVCADQASASHYASLLNEAYESGFKKGLREGRARAKPRH